MTLQIVCCFYVFTDIAKARHIYSFIEAHDKAAWNQIARFRLSLNENDVIRIRDAYDDPLEERYQMVLRWIRIRRIGLYIMHKPYTIVSYLRLTEVLIFFFVHIPRASNQGEIYNLWRKEFCFKIVVLVKLSKIFKARSIINYSSTKRNNRDRRANYLEELNFYSKNYATLKS